MWMTSAAARVSELAQSLPKWAAHAMSAFPRIASIKQTCAEVRNVPQAEVVRLIRPPRRRCSALLICPNDVGTGSNRYVPSQLTVEALGDFGET
jgi:hypothetical protein